MKKEILLLLAILALATPANAKVFYGNFHTHVECHSDDGQNSYEDIVEKAVSRHFDFIALTSHGICEDELEKCRTETRILCIPGQEITTPQGHVLSIGWHMTSDMLHSLEEARNLVSLPLPEVAEMIKANNGVSIAAHPVVDGFRIGMQDIALFDAMECDHPVYLYKQKKEAEQMQALTGKPCSFDSDAHNKKALSLMYNACDADELTQESILKSLKAGKCTKEQPLLAKIKRYLSMNYWII